MNRPAEIALFLRLGLLLLGAGSLSMLIVRLTSPGLRGVGRFSGAFAAGTLGTALQVMHGIPLFSVFLTDIALLSSFVLMHMAVLRLVRPQMARLWHGIGLLAIQMIVDVLLVEGVVGQRARVISMGLLMSVQAVVTALTIWPLLKKELRAPAGYCIVLLLGFGVTNVLRSAALAMSRGDPAFQQRLGYVTFSLFLVVLLGLAFGFLWMTTSSLTADVEHLASTDPLTRVYNRRVFLNWCEKELLRTQRSGNAFSLLMVDLDHFKQINDNFGHQRGDEVLCAAVERMQDSVRGIDVICRWGGEEFAVLLPNASLEATGIVAERIRQNIQKMRVPLHRDAEGEAGDSLLTVSIGSATYRDLDDDITAMLLRADRALYRAKAAGRNQVLLGA